MTQNNMEFPIRINTYLAHTGVCTRKQADSLISQGKIFINKKIAKLGQMVQQNDVVETKGFKKEFVYALWNKPRGVSTPDSKMITVAGKEVKTHAIGRLDKETDGLILLSNDTRLSEKLLNPKYNHEKEYDVSVREHIVGAQLQRLLSGVRISHEGRKVTVKAKHAEKKTSSILTIVLTEGKKHQVRQMCSAVNLTVDHLRRTRIQGFSIGKLRSNQVRELSETEIATLLTSVALS